MARSHRWGSVLLGVVLVAGTATAVLGQEAPPPEPPSAIELSILGRLDAARAAVGRLHAAGQRAEYERAEAERATTAVYEALAEAERALSLTGMMVESAQRSVDRAKRERLAAQERLDFDAATSYKFNGARGTALLFELMASSGDPNDFARNMYALESVMVRRQVEVARLIDEVASEARRLEVLMTIRGAAYLNYQEVLQAVEDAETEAADMRAKAAEAEEALLRAAAVALAVELEAADAQVAIPPAPPGQDVPAAGPIWEIAPEEELTPQPPPPPDSPAPTEDPVVEELTVDFEAVRAEVEQRQEWLANRMQALVEDVELDPSHRRVQRDLVCPVDGETEFSNDWHYPRSHGRRHKGIDILSERGTPVVALADGVVTTVDREDNFDGETDLGGLSVTYETPVGRFYAAHLDAIVENLEDGDEVTAGQVLGFLGTSGNAVGTPPHLHLGWYFGESAINPFPTVALVCAEVPEAQHLDAPVR